jgi:hypothetical protein
VNLYTYHLLVSSVSLIKHRTWRGSDGDVDRHADVWFWLVIVKSIELMDHGERDGS